MSDTGSFGWHYPIFKKQNSAFRQIDLTVLKQIAKMEESPIYSNSEMIEDSKKLSPSVEGATYTKIKEEEAQDVHMGETRNKRKLTNPTDSQERVNQKTKKRRPSSPQPSTSRQPTEMEIWMANLGTLDLNCWIPPHLEVSMEIQ